MEVQKKTSICVILMVKDEEHCILETLNSTLRYASEYIICDTGSTDGTIDVCNKFFETNNIKGQIFHHEWKNFGYNYTILYQLGKRHSTCEYLWQIDADDIVCGNMKIENLYEDAYSLKFGKTFTYRRPQILSNRIEWKHVGVIHGYTTPADITYDHSVGTIDGDYYIDSRRLGNRHKNIDPKIRFAEDAKILEQGLIDEPNNSRYMFYLGQCYFDSGQYEKSAEAYNRRVQMGGWEEEIYYSRYRIGQCYRELKKPMEKIKNKYLNCYKNHMNRAEPLYDIGILYGNLKEWKLSKEFLKKASKIPFPSEMRLFQSKNIYDYDILNNLGVAYYYLHKYQKAHDIFDKLLKTNLSDSYKDLIEKSKLFCIDKLSMVVLI